jgi:hypothetical protein
VARHHAEYVKAHIKEKVTVMYLGGADLISKCVVPSLCKA